MKCLSLYWERDEIEKSFKSLKNEIDILPLNAHSDKTTRGFIFIAFLSLIVRSRLINMMREAKILDKYSVELLLFQLEKLRKITLADGQISVTEMTKKTKRNTSGAKLVRLNFREIRKQNARKKERKLDLMLFLVDFNLTLSRITN